MNNLGRKQHAWLQSAIHSMSLSSDHLGYLYGRGGTDESIQDLGLVTWNAPSDPSPDPEFSRVYGERGERLERWLVCPVICPTGQVVGLNCRDTGVRQYSRYRSRLFPWAPTMVGMSDVLEKAAQGGSVWLVEGIYDLLPLRCVVPEQDAVGATQTARLSTEQAVWLSRFCRKRVYVAYDMDSTGKKAAEFAVRKLKKLGVHAIRWEFTGGKDPGEIWDTGGISAMRAAFA